MPLLCKPCSSIADLRLHVYVTGYPVQGESVLFIVACKDEPILTIVTDSFRSDEDYCHVENLLKNWGSPPIDIFIWTHPDEDHSVGIEKLLDTFDNERNCHIFIPQYLHNADRNAVCVKGKEAMDHLSSNYNRSRKVAKLKFGKYHEVGYDPAGTPIKYFIEIKDTTTNDKLPLSIEVLGPISQISLQHTDGTIAYKNNPMSVVYKLDANGVGILMTGDMNKYASKQLPADSLKNIHFLKIPHHGSDEPEGFPARLVVNEQKDKIGVSTVCKKGGYSLPVDKMIKDYSRYLTELYLTGDHSEYLYGCVHITYNLLVPRREKEVVMTGNAYRYS